MEDRIKEACEEVKREILADLREIKANIQDPNEIEKVILDIESLEKKVLLSIREGQKENKKYFEEAKKEREKIARDNKDEHEETQAGVESAKQEIKNLQEMTARNEHMLKSISMTVNELSKSVLKNINLPTDGKDKISQEVTKLHDAVSADNEKSVKVLLEEKVEVNAKTVNNLITPLHIAAQNGNKEIVNYLLNAEDINVNAKTEQNATPLHYAAQSGHKEIVKALLNKGAEINVKVSNDGFTPLHYAAENGHGKVIKVLLEREGININETNNQGATALHIAAASGHKEVVEHLLARKDIVVDVKTAQDECTPLYYAAQSGFNEVVKALLNKNVKVINTKNFEGNTPLHVAASRNHLDVVKTLLNQGASANEINNQGGTPLHYAAQNNFINVVEALLEVDNINVNIKTKGEGATPLHYAAKNGCEKVVEVLLDKGADFTIQTNDQNLTPLHIAARANHKEVVKLLLNKGADINVKTIHGGFTPLHIATVFNNREVIEVLLNRGAKVDLKSAGGNMPLCLAVQSGRLDVVKDLLDKGANLNAQNGDQGATSLHAAAKGGHKEIVEVLLNGGALVNEIDNQGETPLHYAAENGHTNIVETLLKEKGINVNVKTDNGVTQLHYAAQNGNAEIIKLLLKSGANIEAADINDWTPLHDAAHKNHLNVVTALLNGGANINATNKNNEVPFSYTTNDSIRKALKSTQELFDAIRQKQNESKIQQLLRSGASVNAVSGVDRLTVLHFAVSNGDLAVIKRLLEKRPNIDAVDEDGWTPLHYAAQDGYSEVVKLLLDRGADRTIKNKNGKIPLDLAQEKLGQNSQIYQEIIDILKSKSIDRQQKTGLMHQEGKVSAEKCLPSTSSGRRRNTREAGSECLFTWEDVNEFNAEKDEKRDFSKIKIDSGKFVNYIKDLPEEKQSQLIQLADETGNSQGLVSKLIKNQKVMNHLGRVGKISGMTMRGMIAKNVLADFLNGDYQGVAINVGFIAGGQGFAKVAKAASLKGLKLASEGKLLLGRSLRAASPFLARGTSAFVVYDLVNQVKAFKNGTEEALVGVVGDSIYLGVDAAEIGIEIAEAFEVLEGVSSVTGPIGAAIGAVVFVGTDIYMAVKRVDKIDEIIHLTGKERFVEGLRAFIGMQPENHIQELLQEKEVSNELVRQGFEYLKEHSDIQSYVFPTGKSVVDSCRDVPYQKSICSGGFNWCSARRTVTRYTEKCTTKFEVDLDSTVLLDRKRTDIRWSRARPDNPSGVELFCLPQGNDLPAPSYGSYLCENAIGLSTEKRENYTLIDLGKGDDYAKGFLNSPNIFVVDNGFKRYYGGNKDDIFILQGNFIEGYINGGDGANTVDLEKFAPEMRSIEVRLGRNGYISYINNNSSFGVENINRISGRKNKSDIITCDYSTKYVDGQGGESDPDVITIPSSPYFHEMHLIARSGTSVVNHANSGSFNYTILPDRGKAQVNISLPSLLTGLPTDKHNFFFNSTISDLIGVYIQNVSQISNYTVKSATFSFLSNDNKLESEFDSRFDEGKFNITISDIPVNASYGLSNGVEIKIGNKDNLYLLQSSNDSAEEIIKNYLPIAIRLNRMSFFIQSLSNNETVVIGSGNHEIIHNNPVHKSHLVGNGGENVYVIDSEIDNVPEVIIHDIDEENSIDTIDLRNVVKKAKDNFELQVIKSENGLLLRATVEKQKEDYFTIKLKDGVERYNKTHVIVENAPMIINVDNNQWSLKPQPLVFEKDKEIVVITDQDVEKGTELVTPRKGGNYKFVRSSGNDLIITNAFDSSITKDDLCTITLSKFYETPKMATLSIKFANEEIMLKDHEKEISAARDVNIVKKEHKDQVYSDVFNRGKQQTRHRRHKDLDKEFLESSSTRPSSWINDLFGWVKSSVSGLLGSKSKETSSTASLISQVDAKMDVNGTIMLLDVIVRKFTGKQYIPAVDQSIPLLEARGYALNITNRFEKMLNKTAIKSGISVTNLNFDPVVVQSAIIGKIINGKFSEIAKTLYSFAKEACPEFEQTDKFLDNLKSNLLAKEETLILQQKVEKPSKVLGQEVSRKVELSKKPDTFLNGTSVVKGISNVLEL